MITYTNNKFKTIEDIGPTAPWIILCGPTCIGKSYFKKVHELYKLPSSTYKIKHVGLKWVITQFKQLKLYHHNIVACSDYNLWDDNWYTPDYKFNARAIILGVPLYVLQERVLMRGNGPVPDSFIDRYILKYKRWVTRLNEYNIPYIFVDNRNDYPILNKTTFFTMLSSTPST